MADQVPAKHSVLLVDDEPEILFSLQALLRREFELHVAESGQEALEILRQHPIHVIMTDQRMPEMTGVELIGQVRTEYPDAIRMIFTGYADIKAVVDAINNGGLFRYLTKPWDPDELVEVLRDAAAEFNAAVQKRQLLADLREHLRDAQRIAKRMLEQDVDGDVTDVKQFIEQDAALLNRLEQHVA